MHATSYGTFPSPITADLLAKHSTQIRQVLVEHDDVYWLEMRPSEKGRITLTSLLHKDILPDPYFVRTQVHEYGGKCSLFHDGTFYFSHSDHALYKMTGTVVTRITNAPTMRFADFVIHPNGKWLFAVCEDHKEKEVKNSLVKIHIDTGTIEPLASAHDFYMAPRLSPNGGHLAYIAWDHPNMPWDKTELWISDLNASGLIESERKLTGMDHESVLEPLWSPDGVLYFVSDRNGYWNIYNEENDPISEMNADFAMRPWTLGNKSYTFITLQGRPHIAAIYTEKGIDGLALIDLEKHSIKKLDLPYTSISDLHTRKERLVFVAGSRTTLTQLIELDPLTSSASILADPNPIAIDPQLISQGELIEFPSLGGKSAFAFFYPPKNPHCQAPSNEKPPLLVLVHGGPTSHVPPSLKLNVQFWTSRGFAVCDVNYSGSSGFGREYRDRLLSNWGVVDVFDVRSAANYLVEKGLVDKERMIVAGGSAGGYTTLAALTFSDTFKAGTSYYGISDLSLMLQETHKFESHYLDGLIGPYPAKEALYKERSPIYHTDQLNRPVLFLQGALDKVVPPNQAEKLHDILLKKNIPTTYILFPEEAHGFRGAHAIATSLDSELAFYRKLFKL